MTAPLTYADAGVDINKANTLVDKIKGIAKQTFSSSVMGEIGGFGGLFSLNTTNMEKPVLVGSTDGVGTKLKIAFMMDKHDTIGIDLVAMSVNDIAVQGAKPLFFLDYLSMGKLDTKIATKIIQGIGRGCKQADCALIGGETAEMPGFYGEREYDLAGFSLGIVDNNKIIDGSEIGVGNRIIGVSASGLHSNGYSLVRKICFDLLKLKVDDPIPELGRTLGEELLIPTRIYTGIIQTLARDLPIHGLSHITGGGIAENLVRILPATCNAQIKKDAWKVPPVFTFLKQAGKIEDMEMMRTFNNGIGLIMVVPESTTQDIMERLGAMDEKVFILGQITKRKGSGPRIHWV